MDYDLIIVGARVAGSALAALLFLFVLIYGIQLDNTFTTRSGFVRSFVLR